jgi:hypothetical protein
MAAGSFANGLVAFSYIQEVSEPASWLLVFLLMVLFHFLAVSM